MKQILKRLELIKTAISLEDEEIIELQIMKLNAIACDDAVEAILLKLDDKDYGNVAIEIEEYLQKFSGVVVYEDKELEGLRLELKALEKKLQDLSSEKNEYLNDIHEFNIVYHLHLGAIIQKILKLKEELLFASLKSAKDAFEKIEEEYQDVEEEYQDLKSQKEKKEEELEELNELDDDYEELYDELQELEDELKQKEKDLNEKQQEVEDAKEKFEEDEVTQEYEEVKEDSEEFNKEYEEVQAEDRLEITDAEKKELKILYRKASKLCHPDIVADELKEQANEIMQKLNDANSKRDMEAVREILASLESGYGFDVASNTINDKEILRTKIADLRDMIYQNEEDIANIKEDETIKILHEYDDIDEYFNSLAVELENEYTRLKECESKNSVNLKDKQNESFQAVQVDNDDGYWEDEF